MQGRLQEHYVGFYVEPAQKYLCLSRPNVLINLTFDVVKWFYKLTDSNNKVLESVLFLRDSQNFRVVSRGSHILHILFESFLFIYQIIYFLCQVKKMSHGHVLILKYLFRSRVGSNFHFIFCKTGFKGSQLLGFVLVYSC